jgi:putative ABC transport system ATP-binding protein
MNTPRPTGTAAATDSDDTAVVRAERLTRCFKTGTATVVAVRGVTVSVAPHARIALTGPSGSGKTTLLHLLAGLDTPTAGTICWPGTGHDQVPRSAPEQVGLVFQGDSLVPTLDVTENVCLPLLLAGHPPGEATTRALSALHRLGIAELAGAVPDELSGGQAQRVAIARVLAAAPRVILADEPTARLDHTAAATVMDVLISAADEGGSALIVSTHDPMIARRLLTEWSMHDGRLNTTGKNRRRS